MHFQESSDLADCVAFNAQGDGVKPLSHPRFMVAVASLRNCSNSSTVLELPRRKQVAYCPSIVSPAHMSNYLCTCG
jgi:hypothetical protein